MKLNKKPSRIALQFFEMKATTWLSTNASKHVRKCTYLEMGYELMEALGYRVPYIEDVKEELRWILDKVGQELQKPV